MSAVCVEKSDSESIFLLLFFNPPPGLAHVCVVTDCMTLTRARIEMPIPRKRRASCASHDKVMLSHVCMCVCVFKEENRYFLTAILPGPAEVLRDSNAGRTETRQIRW